MLILTRRIGESLCIGDDITVTVMGLNGQQVRIGVAAPNSVRIYRSELLDGSRPPAASDSSKPEQG